MKTFLLTSAIFFVGCASKTLVRTEPSEKIGSNQNMQREQLMPQFDVSIQRVSLNDEPFVTVSILKTNQTRVSWTDIYASADIYEEYCKSLASRIYYAYFSLAEAQKNGEKCETKYPNSRTIIKKESDVEKNNESLDGLTAKLTIGGNPAISQVKNGAAHFSYKELKLGQKKLPTDLMVRLYVSGVRIDISREFLQFANTENTLIEREEAERSIATENAVYGDDPPNLMLWEKAYEGSKIGKCFNIIGMPAQIVQKIDDNTYEMVLPTNGLEENHLILRTKTITFGSTGRPRGLFVKHTGSRKVTLKNGFQTTYQVLSECLQNQ